MLCRSVPPRLSGRSDTYAQLTQVSIDELINAFGLGHVRRGRWLLEWLFCRPAQQFAAQLVRYDQCVGTHGLQAGGQWILERFVTSVQCVGQEHIPRTGPLLVVANHPGLYDSTLLYATIPRPDLRILAADRPFLQALPNTSRYLLTMSEDASERPRLVRSAARHLRQGGAMLLFPSGKIEPDPLVVPGALEALEQWSLSMDLFVKLVPGVQIVPAVVGGVLSPTWQRNWLARLRRREEDRRWLAATMQFMRPSNVHVRVTYGPPVAMGSVVPDTDAGSISRLVLADMHRLMQDTACRTAGAR